MEKRAIIAAVLMAAVLMIYQMYFIPTQHEPPPAPVAKNEPEPVQAPLPSRVPPPAPSKAPPRPVPVEAARKLPPQPHRIARVDTPLYHAAVSNDGGKLQEWTLKYRGDKPIVIVGEQGPLGLLVGLDASLPAAPIPMAMDEAALTLGARKPTEDLVLTGGYGGLDVRQELRFNASTYTVDAVVRIANQGPGPQAVTVSLPWAVREHDKTEHEQFNGQRATEIVWSSDGHVHRASNPFTVGDHTTGGAWIAADSTWYLAALIPKSPGFTLVTTTSPQTPDPKARAETRIALQAAPTIGPGETWEGRARLFIGPKEYDRLRAEGLEGTLNFGGFPIPRAYGGLPMEWLGIPILRLMNWTYQYVGNYGLAIILLTIISKVLFYPLTVKSMRSMRAMQGLQPQVNTLRNKYKSDPRKLQEETLALYRKHKVNPMGGCLPMVAQIPIFYALYLALSVSVELQNAAFICIGHVPAWVPLIGSKAVWLCDLANPDPTYVLPILMGVTMFLQQKMTPTAGDPRQQKMMLFMPFIFTWMFFNLASGLVLYWTVSNVLQILQQRWMDRSGSQRARESKQAARA